MMSHIRAAISQQARLASGATANTRMGIISSSAETDGPPGYVKVRLQPDDIETGWLPMLTSWLGNGWGMVAVPPNGTQVAVVFQEGDVTAGIVVGLVPSDLAQPPRGKGGEFWLVHQSGQFIKLLNDGTISSKGNWTHDGKFTATGDVTSTGGEVVDHIGKLSGLRTHYNAHIHSGVQTGAGVSGVPTVTDP